VDVFQIRFISEKTIFVIMVILMFPTVLLLIAAMFDEQTISTEISKVVQ